MADNVKVAVRVRPFNSREKDLNAKCCVTMRKDTQQTVLVEPESAKERVFTFDFSYNSYVDRDDPEYASQAQVWSDIGVGVLQNAYEGYNCSLFAYGQTGAGKSYSMMGYGEDKGIIPIACERIFDRIDSNTDDTLSIKVEASMLEIYMEKVRDLFNPKAGELKIRNDPKRGFYVDNLTRNAVASVTSINKMMDAGTKARTVASTNMNATSSRAHTIFQIVLTQTKVDAAAGKATDKVAIINLIDLAGSERQSGTGATGDRLKEGSAINLSLSSLGNCISALATNSGSGEKKVRVPYRDSVLTMLLQNSLGGNAKTIMIAAISPADINHDETLSTLRYADRAKQIKNNAVVNEDPNEKMIRNLKSEIEQLRKMLEASGGGGAPSGGPGYDPEAMSTMLVKEREEMRLKFEVEAEAERQRIRAELQEKIRQEMQQSMSWEERLKETEARQREHEAELRAMGVTMGEERAAELELAKTVPHMVNLHEDGSFSEQIHHFFGNGVTLRIGREDAPVEQAVCISGLNIEAQHAIITNVEGRIELTLPAPTCKAYVNGELVGASVTLHHFDRIIFGQNHVFKVVVPDEAASYVRPSDVPAHIDYTFAVMEINKAQVQAIAAAEASRRAEAEAARQKAEEQIREIEARLLEERQRAEEESEKRRQYYEEKEKELIAQKAEGLASGLKEQQQRLLEEKEAMMKAMQDKHKELEAKLQAQIAETNAIAKRQAKEAKERNLLDEKLLKAIPLVNEANAYSEQLGVGLGFSVKLMSIPGKKVLGGAGGGDPASAEEEGKQAPVLDTDVFVRVDPHPSPGGQQTTASKFSTPFVPGSTQKFWGYDKFVDRLYNMREMYQMFIEKGRDLTDSIYATNPKSDPFYDEPEDLHIGRATVYLDPLVYAMFVNEWTPIIDYKGQSLGEVLLRVVPHKAAQAPEGDPDTWDASDDSAGQGFTVDSLEELKGQKIFVTVSVVAGRGFPPDRCSHNFVKYRFFVEEDSTTVPTLNRTMNPKFNYSKTFPLIVSPEFLTYVSTETLEFEVYGREEETDSRPTTAMPGSAYANVLLKSKSAKGLFSPDSQLSTVSEQPSVGADVFNVEDDQKAKEEENQALIQAAVDAERKAAGEREAALAAKLAEVQAKAAAAEAAQRERERVMAAEEAARREREEETRRAREEEVRLKEEEAKQAKEKRAKEEDAESQSPASASRGPVPQQHDAAEQLRIMQMEKELLELKLKLQESSAAEKKPSKVCAIL